MLRGMIFDFDGTLLDSMGMWHDMDRRLLAAFGVEKPAGFSDTVKAMTVPEASAYIVSQFGLTVRPEDVTAKLYEMAAEEYRVRLPLKAGAAEFVKEAANRGIPCVIASTTNRFLLDAALQRTGLTSYFRGIFTPDAGFPGKQTPEMFLAAAELLGTVPAETAVIEDSLYAAETAAKARFYTVGFRDAAAEADWPALKNLCSRVTESWAALTETGFLSEFDTF